MGRRQPTCCQTFLGFVLKFLNYLQTFLGVAIVIYSAFMLNHWHRLHLDSLLPHVLSGDHFNIHSLPAPWFIYAFMGVGIVLCCITCIGHIGAEAMNGCCLCFRIIGFSIGSVVASKSWFSILHAVLITLFVLLEISFVAFIAIDHQWDKDFPVDSTGELDHLSTFFEENREVCELVSIAVIVIQVLSLLLSIVLRALVNQKPDLVDESPYDIRERPWEPLLHPRLNETSSSNGRGGTHSDIWSSRMREKYGLHSGGGNNQYMEPK